MIQLSLLDPSRCPCGFGPVVTLRDGLWELCLWCYCDVDHYFAGDSLPDVLEQWEAVNA